LSLAPVTDKSLLTDEAKVLSQDLGLTLYATPGTASMPREIGLEVQQVEKAEGSSGTAVGVIERGLVDLVANVPVSYDSLGRPDGYAIRRAAIDRGVPLITDPHLAKAMVAMLSSTRGKLAAPQALGDYVARN
jgi:carbamoyl-phosphate synthase large subunit